MALVKCKECGTEISNKAKACPQCGFQQKKDSDSYDTGIGCLFLILVFVAGLYFWPDSSTESVPWENEDASISAYMITEKWVEEELLSPGTAEFPPFLEQREHIISLGYQIYEIDSYVDSQNSSGVIVRTNFYAKVQQTGEDKWKLLELNFE